MIIHVVKEGETIQAISDMYGVSVEWLILNNGITNPENLVIGQTFIIVYPKQTYVAQEGDTLESIAIQFGVTEYQILRNNPMISPNNMIFIGETLIIEYETEKKGTITTNAFAFPYIDQSVLRIVLPYLSFLTIYSYGLTPQGALIQIDDQAIIDLARSYSVAPAMMISTELRIGVYNTELTHRILTNVTAQNRLIQNVIDNILSKGYISINVNFGKIYIEDKRAYVDFINNMVNQLYDAGLRITVTIDPNTNMESRFIYEGHDYAGLGKKVNSVLINTFSIGAYLGPTMPIAPINVMREIFDYAVTQISHDKMYFGIPTYGYEWRFPYIPGQSEPHILRIESAIELAVQVGAQIQYDEVSQAPFYQFSEVTPTEEINHIVWFEDARSINAKLSLIPEYQFPGTTALNAMSFFQQLWLEINIQFDIRRYI